MVQAWYMDSNEPVSLETLSELGVFSTCIDADTHETNGELEKLCKERNYGHKSIVNISPATLPNYDQMLAKFFQECVHPFLLQFFYRHLHEFEEIRYALDGSGYFDVRDKKDQWIRIHIVKNDLIVLPAGIYHRFTLDDKKYIKAMRLFLAVTEPIWTPINREESTTDGLPCRNKYVSDFLVAK